MLYYDLHIYENNFELFESIKTDMKAFNENTRFLRTLQIIQYEIILLYQNVFKVISYY